MSPMMLPLIAMGGIVLFTFIVMIFWLTRYRKAGPNQALVVSGRMRHCVGPDGKMQTRGYRIVKGGGTFVVPVIERVDVLPLELFPVEVRVRDAAASSGGTVRIEGTAQIRIQSDDASLAAAVEQLLGKPISEIKSLATQRLETGLRALLATMTVGEVTRNQTALAARFQGLAAGGLAKMGLGMESFAIRNIETSGRS